MQRIANVFAGCAALAACLLLAGCSGGSYETEAEAAVEAWLRSGEDSSNASGFDDASYKCASERVVEAIDIDKLEAEGLTLAGAEGQSVDEDTLYSRITVLRLWESTISCLDEPALAVLLAEDEDPADVEIYECVVAELGGERVGDLLFEEMLFDLDEIGIAAELADCREPDENASAPNPVAADDDYETKIEAALEAELKAEIQRRDLLAGADDFDSDTYECISEQLVEHIGIDELQAEGVTPANVEERFANWNSLFGFTTVIHLFDVAASCLDSSEQAKYLAAADESADLELYECVVDASGEQRAGDLLIDAWLLGPFRGQVAGEVIDCRESAEDAAPPIPASPGSV